MTGSAPATNSLRLDDHGALLDEVPCRGCGYLLRGLKAADMCPECGRAVNESLQSDLLRDSDKPWLRRLALGCSTIIFAAVLWVACFVPETNGIVGEAELLGLVPAALNVIGYFLISAPEPNRLASPSEHRARAGIRLAAILYAALVVIRMAFLAGESFGLVVLDYFATGAVTIVWVICTLVYFTALAKRLPSPVLVNFMRVLWALPFFGVLFGLAMANQVMHPLDSGPSTFVVITSVPFGFCWLLWFIALCAFRLRFSGILASRLQSAPKTDPERK